MQLVSVICVGCGTGSFRRRNSLVFERELICFLFSFYSYNSRRRGNPEGTSLQGQTLPPSQQQQQLQQQIVAPAQDSYMQSREEALRNVEATIIELSTIFTHLANMVAEQGTIAVR